MQSFPNRCQHLKINGTQCGSPALRRNRFCFFHKRFQDERIKLSADRARRGVATFVLPVLEDANSIQIALMQVMRLLISQQIDHKTASLLLYALQTASTNLRMTNFATVSPMKSSSIHATSPTRRSTPTSGTTKISKKRKTKRKPTPIAPSPH